MRLRDIVGETTGLIGIAGDADVEIAQICADSRRTEQLPGSLFFCVSGATFDGHRFARQAVAAGAVALAVERLLPDLPVPQVQVEDMRAAMAEMSGAFYGHPARQMKMIAITGTKGKTTTTYFVKAILEAHGLSCGLIGSVGSMIGQRMIKSNLTTPESVDLNRVLRQMVDAGARACVMEASAHAMDMHRLYGIQFDAVAYTNLTQDHLDYFHTMGAYARAKKRLFTKQYAKNAAFNADDETTAFMLEGIEIPFVTYGIRAKSDIHARDIEINESGVSFMLHLRGVLKTQVDLKLTGMFNVYNAMCAAALGMIIGAPMEAIKRGLEAVQSVPGRAEVLDTDTPFRVILDFSHVPSALENILTVMRDLAKHRVISLFGCGGDRDREKRPMMGEISGRLADFSILTSDNARGEDPYDILEMVEEGIKPTGGAYCIIEDRREAIRYALQMAREGDIIVLAGKGDETYQEVRGVKRPFDERLIVAELLEEMAKGEGKRHAL